MDQQEGIVKEFIELVEIDSLSKKEGRIARRLKKVLEELGLKVKIDSAGEKVGGETGNLIAKLNQDSSFPTLMLSAHMDTVTPGKGIKAVINDGIISSQGDTILGADDKAGLAIILNTVRKVIEKEIKINLEVVFTIGEEQGLIGAKNLNYELLESKLCLAFDSGGEIGTIIVKAPAQDAINIKVRGKSAHAGVNPSDGINAIKVASRALSNMHLGQIDEETTANIGVIKGGQATNIVPDYVELEGEARSRNEKKLLRQTEHMCNKFKEAADKYNAETEIDVERIYPVFDLERNNFLVEKAIKAAKKINVKAKLKSTGGGSDANIFNGNGITTINLGIGMQDVHSTDEHIKISDLLKAAEFSLAIVQEIAD